MEFNRFNDGSTNVNNNRFIKVLEINDYNLSNFWKPFRVAKFLNNLIEKRAFRLYDNSDYFLTAFLKDGRIFLNIRHNMPGCEIVLDEKLQEKLFIKDLNWLKPIYKTFNETGVLNVEEIEEQIRKFIT